MLIPALGLALAIQFTGPAAPARQPQLAARGRTVVLTYGAGDSVFFAKSDDEGRTWTKPVAVWSGGRVSLGMRRGPRIALAGKSILISATVDETGKGGDLLLWASSDGGMTWSKSRRLNDVPASAREGLHAMTAHGDRVFAAWLDARARGTRLYGAASDDGGATWTANRLIYASPSGSICECCDPSVAIDDRGNISVMFRNQAGGNRDMYLARSTDGGKSFPQAQKLGTQSWKLDACPMDGGDLKLDSSGGAVAVWRRQEDLFLSDPNTAEKHLAPGKNAALALTPAGGWIVYTDRSGLQVLAPGDARPRALAAQGAFPALAVTSTGRVIAAWESSAGISVEPLSGR